MLGSPMSNVKQESAYIQLLCVCASCNIKDHYIHKITYNWHSFAYKNKEWFSYCNNDSHFCHKITGKWQRFLINRQNYYRCQNIYLNNRSTFKEVKQITLLAWKYDGLYLLGGHLPAFSFHESTCVGHVSLCVWLKVISTISPSFFVWKIRKNSCLVFE